MTATTPWLLWLILTAGSVAVGGAMLWIAFASFNKRERQRRGSEVKTTESEALSTGER